MLGVPAYSGSKKVTTYRRGDVIQLTPAFVAACRVLEILVGTRRAVAPTGGSVFVIRKPGCSRGALVPCEQLPKKKRLI